MVAFLGSCGHDTTRLLDYDDGLTMGSLLAMSAEVGRQLLIREKTLVNGVSLALASLFDKDVLGKFNATLDKVIDGTREGYVEDGAVDGEPGKKPRGRTFSSKAAAAQHSIRELNKLNVLLMS